MHDDLVGSEVEREMFHGADKLIVHAPEEIEGAWDEFKRSWEPGINYLTMCEIDPDCAGRRSLKDWFPVAKPTLGSNVCHNSDVNPETLDPLVEHAHQMAHVTMMIKLEDMDGETRAECRESANTFYEALRVLAGVTVDVNETDDGYLVGQIHDLPDDKAAAIECIVSFTTFVESATI
jgi:hypothetical protein